MKPFLYGLEYASHDFTNPKSLGKNIFTNAFPISIAQYLSEVKKLHIPLIKAQSIDGKLSTKHILTAWEDIIGISPSEAFFEFEGTFAKYDQYTHTIANRSDIIVKDRITHEDQRGLEVKLVVVPTSSTATKPHNEQSCEIVARPPTVEQLAFSIAHSFGKERRQLLLDILMDKLHFPNDYRWKDESWMLSKMPDILQAAESIAIEAEEFQTPLVLTAIWRTQGQKPLLSDNAFDAFVWTDMAFVQLFTDATRRAFYTKSGKQKTTIPKTISRPNRALVWLINALWDYTTQGSLNFARVSSSITYGVQSDKAASFTGSNSLDHMASTEFFSPRISSEELEKIMSPEALDYLVPERRLDASIAIQHLLTLEKKRVKTEKPLHQQYT